MNIQLLGIGSLLHSFSDDQLERRQYPRVPLRFELWWLKDLRGSRPEPGIGIEISGGGLQFLLHHHIGSQCSLAFQIRGRHMRASVDVLHTNDVVFEGQAWQHYRAKFVGLMEADFDFIMALSDELPAAAKTLDTQPVPHPVRDISLGSHQSYDLLPGRIQEKIVAKLVELKRLAPPLDLGLPFLAAHYAGITHPNDSDAAFHRFFVRSHITSRAGTFVYNTEALVSDDGTTVHVRE